MLRIKNQWLCVMLLILVAGSMLLSSITGDIHVFTAMGRQADFGNGNWLYNVYNQWELKGVFSRIYSYLIYFFAVQVVPFYSFAFETTLKIIGVLLIAVVSVSSAWIMAEDSAERKQLVAVFMLSFLSLHVACQLQAEMICALLSLLALSCLVKSFRLEQGRVASICAVSAGVLIASLFYFKSVLIIMGLAILAAAVLLTGKVNKRLSWQAVISCVVCLAIVGVSIVIVNPQEFANMLAASAYQQTVFSGGKIPFFGAGYQFARAYFYVPVVLVGLVPGIFEIAADCQAKRLQQVLWRMVMWGVPTAFIVLSNKYFAYHFTMLLFPALVELMLLLKRHGLPVRRALRCLMLAVFVSLVLVASSFIVDITYSPRMNRIVAVLGAMVIMAAVILAIWRKYAQTAISVSFVITSAVFFTYNSVIAPTFWEARHIAQEAYCLNANLQVDTAARCLYLDSGDGARVLALKSVLPEFYPLPLQRIGEDSPYARMESRVRDKELALHYTGRYVSVAEPWFFAEGHNKDIRDYIDNNYHYIASVAHYSAVWDIQRVTEKDIHYTKLLERNGL